MWHSLAVPRVALQPLPAPHRDCPIASERTPGRAAPSIEQAQRAAATGSPGLQLAQDAQPAAMAALQRLSSCVGLGLGTPRIVAAAAASSSSLWLRAYSGDAAGGSDKPADAEAAPAAEAAAADVPAAAEEPAAEVHPALIGAQAGMVRCRAPAHLHGQLYAAAVCLHAPRFHQPCVLASTPFSCQMSLPSPPFADADGSVVPAELFSKRQLTRMGVIDPDRTKHFLPRLSRAELGSFADDYAAEEFDLEVRLTACGGRCVRSGGANLLRWRTCKAALTAKSEPVGSLQQV